ncbi:transcription elongation factor GreA [Candidatus Karelsulcia muelleri]|uniref:Transcription elongation factor GreA n=1 Tax=Candidatus Karelsulcia muelleri PSPU TaxID=1189303 RepID=A0AAD1EXF1_9FLAO|nr:transcription elongation factor GreA [Candidatus Karelsulcia muelleri]BAO66370.1 transcription elongation factor GreB [Candidatus Karelsulcia muelleri PSPU]
MAIIEYNTKKGIKKIINKIKQLETIERKKIIKAISEARDKGDLSENSEYDAAKAAQKILEFKIFNLKLKLSNTRIIDISKISTSQVSIFTKVKLKNIDNGNYQNYTLVPESESNIKKNKISINSPIAIGLIGKKIGDIIYIKLPNNKIINFKLIKIKI